MLINSFYIDVLTNSNLIDKLLVFQTYNLSKIKNKIFD